jgi:hypothetical protein
LRVPIRNRVVTVELREMRLDIADLQGAEHNRLAGECKRKPRLSTQFHDSQYGDGAVSAFHWRT